MLHYDAALDEINWLEASALPMGILANAPVGAPVCREMRPGDLFAVITDGFYEYQNRAGEPFGDERIGAWLRTVHRSGVNQSSIECLCEKVLGFAGGAPQEDDMTAIAIRRTPSPGRSSSVESGGSRGKR